MSVILLIRTNHFGCGTDTGSVDTIAQVCLEECFVLIAWPIPANYCISKCMSRQALSVKHENVLLS